MSSPIVKENSRSMSPTKSTPLESKKTIYKPFAQKLTFICKFCGGKSCKHENYLTHPESAIKGLNCDWITSNILATQRPSSRIIKEFNIIKAFQEKGINAIFNLQEPGEHPHCGDGIHPSSGFSYFPEEFYEHGIYFFNFGWKDMTATSTDVVLKILKQMSFSLMNGNKIAIHCHAGRGRTGLLIAAWLIYYEKMTAKEAIRAVRSKRKGCIQSKSQEVVLFKLEKEIRESRVIFHLAPKMKLEDYIFHQKKLLPLTRDMEIRFIPNIIHTCLERIDMLVSTKNCTAKDAAVSFYNPNDSLFFKGEWTSYHDKNLKIFKDKVNDGDFHFSDIDDPRILTQALLDYLDNFTVPAIKNQFVEIIHEKITSSEKLTRDMKDQFFSQLDKKEFLLVECFARFFAKLSDGASDETLEHIRKAANRVCISLLLERKNRDKLFMKRSLIKEQHTDDRVTHLYMFLLKWIENFSESFSENFMVQKSPLKLHARGVEIKANKAYQRRGTYMNRLIGGSMPNSAIASPADRSLDMSKSPLNSGRGSESSYDEVRFSAPGASSFSPIRASHQASQDGNNTPHKNENSRFIQAVQPEARIHSDIYHENSNNAILPQIKLVQTNSANNSTENPPNSNSNERLPAIANSYSTIGGASPNRKPRISFMAVDSNPFLLETSNEGSRTNLNKNYDNFFSQNALIMEDGEEQTKNRITEQNNDDDSSSSDSIPSKFSDKDKFEELVDQIDNLSDMKKAFLLKKLKDELEKI